MAVKQTAKSRGSNVKAGMKKSAKVMEKKSLAGKKSTGTRVAVKFSTAQKPFSKTEIVKTIADYAGISKKDADATLFALGELINCHIKKGAVGRFVLPGMLRVQVQHKPAVKARKGINPFTKEEVMFKAKPARNVVRIKPLKKLKDMV